ncbi:MAG: nitrophenyl compound nitroreductase subunit ArsF family protein [bacterium]|nr:nitrophenyl compound nitroreductase subunit ArsF family protein [bacterium]
MTQHRMFFPVTALVIAALMLPGAGGSFAEELAVAPDTALPSIPHDGHVVVAYYFYTTLRCENCLRIETWSKQALDSAFVEQQSAGLLWWRPLNTDLNPYAHFTTDYKLERKSLVIAEFEDGEQVRWKKCESVWDLLEDKPGFAAYIQTEVSEYLSP